MTSPRVLISRVGFPLTRVLLLIAFYFLNFSIHTALSGQGINRATFTNSEIDTTIHQFTNLPDGAAQATVGTQPTIDCKQVITGVANNVKNAYSTQTFPNAFPGAPVVFGQSVTNNDPEAVSLRIRNINATGFQTIAQEEEGSADNRAQGNETVHYIAVQAGDYSSLNARAGKSSNAATHNLYSLNFGSAVGTGAPLVMMEMQTVDGGDPCGLRWTENSLSNTGVNVFVEEEDSDGTGEFAHTTEVVGYFVFGTD